MWAAIVLAVGLCVTIWHRGPFFGLIFGLALIAPLAFFFGALWRYAERSGKLDRPRARGITLAIGMSVAALVAHFLLRPPSGAAIISKHLGLERTGIRDVQSWADVWGIDPAYAVRFRASPAAIKRAVAYACIAPATSQPTDDVDTTRDHLQWQPAPRMPSWWTPTPSPAVQTWSATAGENPLIRLRYDPQSETAYLLVLYF